jgi:hypothetical protein
MPRRTAISLNHDLPARPNGLSSDALSKVFGGCLGSGRVCKRDSDCCAPDTCQTVTDGDNHYRDICRRPPSPGGGGRG